MSEETTKIQVGEGTQAQIIISMIPLGSASGTEYSLDNENIDFEVTFIGKGEYKVMKSDATHIGNGQYECLVNTGATGKASELMAVLKVSGIPTQDGTKTRVEVTPQIPTGIEVV